jgi:hypothetical protein
MNLTKVIKGFFTAIAVSIILTACHAMITQTRPTQPDNFEYVCEQIGLKYNVAYEAVCRLAPRPTIIWTEAFTDYLGVWGFTFVPDELEDIEPYIYINPQGPHTNVTVQHEFAHWILRWLEIDDGTWGICDREKTARELSADGDAWTQKSANQYRCKWTEGDEVD